MSYQQEYNEQSIYKVDCLYSDDIEQITLSYRICIEATCRVRHNLHLGLYTGAPSVDGDGAYGSRKGQPRGALCWSASLASLR